MPLIQWYQQNLAATPAAGPAPTTTTTTPLVLLHPPPVHLHDTVEVWAASYSLITGQTACATWTATTTTAATISAEHHQDTLRVATRPATSSQGRTHHTARPVATTTLSISPWDSAEDELFLLLN